MLRLQRKPNIVFYESTQSFFMPSIYDFSLKSTKFVCVIVKRKHIMQSILLRPNAKINIGLYITEKRKDGYHNLQTVFYPIPLCDELRISAAKKDSLVLEGITLEGNPQENLVMKALRELRKRGYPVPPIQIALKKNIPSGAGLGGGSSDAAFTLRGLNEMFSLSVPQHEMLEIASSLGADCPFFLQDMPQYATGIGDVLRPVNLSLSGKYLLLVKPDDFISTKEAYAGVQPKIPQHDLLTNLGRDITQWQQTIKNDFEQSILEQHPQIAMVKRQIIDAGALYTAMSGSGSAIFGLFNHSKNIDTPFFQYCSVLK